MLTNLPILLSEAAVGPRAGQAAKIPDLFAGMHEYGTLGLVWFDIPQHQGLYHQDWHIEHNPGAATAFRRGASALTLTQVSQPVRTPESVLPSWRALAPGHPERARRGELHA